MIARIVFAAVWLMSGQAVAQSAPDAFPGSRATIIVFGLGAVACSDWLNSRPLSQQGEEYILGFFNGAGAMAGRSVGVSVDALGIIDRVHLECQNNPRELLSNAAGTVFESLYVTNR
jgi:hypothetical protein